MHKELKKIKKALEAQGFETFVLGNGHLLVKKDGRRVTTYSGSPSDGRAWKNAHAAAKRAGFKR